MKVKLTATCPACEKQFPCDMFTREPERVTVTCPSCATTLDVPTRGPVPSVTYPSLDNESGCPKCGAELLDEATSCARCGLVFEKWQGHSKPFRKDKHLKTRWKEVRKLPLEAPEHYSFLEECFRRGQLDDAARAYMVLGREEHLDVSQKIRQLHILAQMNVKKSEKGKGTRFKSLVLVAVLIFFLLVTWFIWSIDPYDLLN